MNQKAYVIVATYGEAYEEYADFTEIQLFVCHTQIEAELFIEAFNNREAPYWEKIEEFFMWRRNGIHLADLSNMDPEHAADLRKYCIPKNISFGYEELDVLALIQPHPVT